MAQSQRSSENWGVSASSRFAAREVFGAGGADADPEEADQDSAADVAGPMRAQIDARVGDREDDEGRQRQCRAPQRAVAREMEDQGGGGAVEERGHRCVAAREGVGLLHRERRPEVRTRAVVDNLEQSLQKPASDDDPEKEERADA